MLSSGVNMENDNACGLGSEIVTGPMLGCCALTIWAGCTTGACSWAYTADCVGGCTPYAG